VNWVSCAFWVLSAFCCKIVHVPCMSVSIDTCSVKVHIYWHKCKMQDDHTWFCSLSLSCEVEL
jgi:hypothetical protein